MFSLFLASLKVDHSIINPRCLNPRSVNPAWSKDQDSDDDVTPRVSSSSTNVSDHMRRVSRLVHIV